jgi:F0F1-type ATP synthase membrane subunit b/b'
LAAAKDCAWEIEVVWFAKCVCSRWLMAALLSVPMILVGGQDRSRLSSNPKTSDVGSPPERETNNTQSIEKSGLGEPAGGRHAMDGWQTSEQFKNSPSLKWMADELGVSTAVAYRLSVAFNFATLVTLIVIPLRSKLPAIFRERTELIRQTLEDAQRASTEAKKRLVAIESRFAKIGFEIMAIQESADQDWKAEEERIRAAIAEDQRRIAAGVEKEIAVAIERARHELQTHAADLAVTLAATRIQVDVSTDQALVRAFIDQLARNGDIECLPSPADKLSLFILSPH